MMDVEWVGVVGAAIGAVATLSGNCLSFWLQNKRQSSLAEKRRQRLRQMLGGERYTWRSIEALAAAVGADESTTAELLIEIDARASMSNSKSWALVSRAPFPDDMQPET